MQIYPIGSIHQKDKLFSLQIDAPYQKALTNINGFSHLQILWWGHLSDSPALRTQLVAEKPYVKSPDTLGVFATRSQFRPNPILLTIISVAEVDVENGVIYTPYIDAEDGSKILDIKPYHWIDVVQNSTVPEWCQHWPKSYEASAHFDWQKEFNF